MEGILQRLHISTRPMQAPQVNLKNEKVIEDVAQLDTLLGSGVVVDAFEKIVDKVLKSVDFKAQQKDVEWAITPGSYSCFGGCYTYLCPKVLEKVFSKWGAYTPIVFHLAVKNYFSPKIVEIFLKYRHKISSEDFRVIIDLYIAGTAQKEARRQSGEDPFSVYTYDPKKEVLEQLLKIGILKVCSFAEPSYTVLGAGFKPSEADFHYLLEKLPGYVTLFDICMKNGYPFDSKDFKKAIDLKIESWKFGIFLHDFEGNPRYKPTKEDVAYAKSRNVSDSLLKEITAASEM